MPRGSRGSRRGRACARLPAGVASGSRHRGVAAAAREGAGLPTGECHASVRDAGAGSRRASSRPLGPLPRPPARGFAPRGAPRPCPTRAAPGLPRAYTPAPHFGPVTGPALRRVERTGSVRPRASNREVVCASGGVGGVRGRPGVTLSQGSAV